MAAIVVVAVAAVVAAVVAVHLDFVSRPSPADAAVVVAAVAASVFKK